MQCALTLQINKDRSNRMRNWSKKIISGILAATMLVSTIPAFSASAEETSEVTESGSSSQSVQNQTEETAAEDTVQDTPEEETVPEPSKQNEENNEAAEEPEEFADAVEIISGKIDSSRIMITGVSSEANSVSGDPTGYGGEKEHVLDGDLSTIWHTAWDENDEEKYISFAFNDVVKLTQIKYVRRAYDEDNGTFLNYTVYAKTDEGADWQSVATGSWTWANPNREQIIEFETPIEAKYIKLVADKTVKNNDFASAAEIEFYENVATRPEITVQPAGGYSDSSVTLNVKATSTDGNTLNYQWYENTENSLFGASEIADAVNDSYTVTLSQGEKKYYFVKVTNSKTGISVISDIAMVGNGTYAAMTGGVGYASLAEAVAAAEAGGTVLVLKDQLISKNISIDKNITIKSEPGTAVTIKRDSTFRTSSIFTVKNGVQFNISTADSGKVIIDGGNSEGNVKAALGAIIVTNGKLYVNSNAVIQNNWSLGAGAAISTSAGGNGYIYIYGTLQNNKSDKSGGAVYSNGNLTVGSGAVMKGNTSGTDGGAIYNYEGGIISINGARFEGNTATGNGGAIYTDGKCTINSGTVTGNTAMNGGGFYIASSAGNRNAEFYGGLITGNTASGHGSDVYMAYDRSFYKGGITVGDAYISADKTLWVTGALTGSIGVNYGGDVGVTGKIIAAGSGYTIKDSDAEKITSLDEKIVFEFTDGSVYGKYAPVKIETQPQSIEKVTLNGTAELSITASSVTGTEVSYQWYKCSDEQGSNPEAVSGAVSPNYSPSTDTEGTFYYYCEVTAEKAQKNISDIVFVRVVNDALAEIPIIVTQPQGGTFDIRQQTTLTVEAKVTDEGTLSYQWFQSADAQSDGTEIEGANNSSLILENELSGTFYYYCVVTNTKDGVAETRSLKSDSAQVVVTEAQAALDGVNYSKFSEALEALHSKNNSGTLTIYKDVTLAETITVSSGADLKIEASAREDGTVPKITLDNAFKNEAFNLSGGTLTIENVAIDGGAVWSNDGSYHEAYMNRGSRNNGRSANKPLIIFNGGTVTLKGSASLQNNVANNTNGGAITMTSGTLNINDNSKITANFASGHGGAVYSSSANSVININGGEISSNQGKTSTGGICADTNTLINIVNGVIKYNFTAGRGGGLFVNGTLNMTGGEVINNYSGTNGAGMVLVGGTHKISGGNIHNNTAGNYGGGICQILGSLTFTENAVVENNSSNASGGGIASIGGPLTISGGTIRNNNAAGSGGGLFKNTEQNVAALSITGGLIEDNYASVSGENKVENDVYVTRNVNLGDFSIPEDMDDVYYFEHTFVLTLNDNYEYGEQTSSSIRFFGKYDLPERERNGYRFIGWFTEPEEGEQVQTGSYFLEKTGITLYAHWEMTATNTITITQQPVGGVFYVEDTNTISTAAVIASDNEESAQADAQLKYQWYSCSDLNGSNGQLIENANTNVLALPADVSQTGTYYYYCVVSGDNAADARTDVVRVDMISKNIATVPVFNSQPSNVDCFVGDDAIFSANASTIDLGTVTYQWYESDDNTANPEGDRAIASATDAEFCLNTSAAGTKYYYVVAANTITKPDGQQTTSTAISDIARLDCHNKIEVSYVNSSDEIMTPAYWDKYRVGTAQNPYDGYISEAVSQYGSYGSSKVPNAFDNNWGTFWETNSGGVKNNLEITFTEPVKLDRILYATRQDGYKGRGYPTTLTIYSWNSGTNSYDEIGVAKSTEYTGYVLFTFPQTIEFNSKMKFEFTASTFNNWASAAELILLKAEDTVIEGSVNITGTAVPGSQLTANVSVTNASSANIAYQWQHSDDNSAFTDIEGATEKTYTIDSIYKDEYIRVVARDSSKEYSGTLVSPSYKGLFVSKLEGDAVVGAELTAKTEYTLGTENFSYVWQRGSNASDFNDISFAQGSTYTVLAADINSYIRVGIKCDDYSSSFNEYVYSEPIFIDVTATMTGAPQVGSTLTGNLSGYDREVSYQWQIGDTADGEFTNIQNAAEKEYTIPDEYLNKFIRVAITVNESSRQLVSEAWQIAQAGTYPELTGDYIYLSDFPSSDILESWVGFGNLMYDKNTGGGTISLKVGGERTYFMKGFGMHADSGLVFDVSDYVKYYHYDRFQGYIGLDFAQGSNGDGVLFDVSVAETYEGSSTKWTRVVTTKALKGDSEAVYVDLDLTNVNYIRIHAGYNYTSASDHAVLADAKLISKNYKPADSGSIIKRVDQYDAEIKAYEQAHSGKSYTELLDDSDYEKLVLQRTFVNDASYSLLKAFLYNDDNIKTMTWFMNDIEALRMYVGGGKPDGSYGRSMEVLRDLYIKHGDDMSDPAHGSLYKKMIITLSLTHSTDVYFWQDTSQKSDPVKRYEIYKKLYDNELLINNVFENLEVEEMRWVMNNIISDDQIEWVNYYVRYHTRIGDSEISKKNYTPGPYYFIRYTMGFDYSKPEFYAADKQVEWEKKWKLDNQYLGTEIKDTNVQDQEKIKVYDIDVEYGKVKLWIVFEAGAVCGGISKTGSNLNTAFGIPSVVIGQPGHAAYLQFATPNDDTTGTWSIENDISGWAGSEKGERMLNGWGNYNWDSGYQVSYVLLAQAALNDPDNYYKSQKLVKIADMYRDDAQKRIDLYREALSVQNINLDAWIGLIDAYKQAGKTEQDFAELANEISQALTYYPLPMWDILERLIKPNVSSDRYLGDVSTSQTMALMKAKNATASESLQNTACRTMANHLLGNNNFKMATFSFDGDKAGTIVLNEMYSGGNELLYCIDGNPNEESSWKKAGLVTEYKLSQEEIESITAENDIHVRLQGTTSYYTIDITPGSLPSGLYSNDNENKITGDISNLQYQTESGEWKDLTSDVTFPGDVTVKIRKKAAGTTLQSGTQDYTFTADKDTENRKYITLDRIQYIGCSSEQVDKNGSALHALDGNINTIWHTWWAGGDNERYIIVKLAEPVYLTAFDYTPVQSGNGNGRFQTCEIYTSMTGEDNSWTLSGSASGWGNNPNKKSLELYNPVYTQYIKVRAAQGVGNFGSAAMLEFFEDTTVENKEIESIEVQTMPLKTEYVVGDELDITGLEVKAHFTDKTEGVINNSMLKFDPTIFELTGKKTITVTSSQNENATATFEVNVAENNKTVSDIFVSQMPEKTRYFVGDTVDAKGLVVKANYTDGSQGYIFDSQYTISPDTLTTSGREVPVTITYTADQTKTTTYNVEVTKTVKEIIVTQNPEKTNYYLGETMDTTGIEVSVKYEDGTVDVLESYDYLVNSTGFSNTSGTKQITVSYQRLESVKPAEFSVLVYPYITSGNLRYESVDNTDTCFVSGVNGSLPSDGKVIIPSTVSVGDLEFTVIAVGKDSANATGAFAGQSGISSVVFPGTVNTITADAFSGCTGIRELYFTEHDNFDSLIVNDGAFANDEFSTGIIYVQSQELADSLNTVISTNENLAGLKYFTAKPITNNITDIRVVPPAKLTYNLGETLDLTGFSVIGITNDNKEVTLSENLYTVTGFDSEVAGNQDIKVALNNTVLSKTFTVQVVPATPVITTQPVGAVYGAAEEKAPLTVEASISDKGNISYQWYLNKTESTEGGTKIEGAVNASYNPVNTDKTFYYVVISNKDKNNTENTAVTTSDIVCVDVGDYSARIEGVGYNTLQEAVDGAEDGDTIEVLKDLNITQSVEISKSVTITGKSIKRSSNFKSYLLKINSGDVKLENITMDGGAVWSGSPDPVLGRDANNTGLQATDTMVVLVSGTLTLSQNAVLQNNYNNGNNYAVSGGAIRVEGGNTTLTISGGSILNNYCNGYGGAVIVKPGEGNSASVVFNSGTVAGNEINNSGTYTGGAFCMDHSSTFTMNGGTIRNNQSGSNGSAMWISNGKATFNGGRIIDNNSSKGSGTVFISGNGTVELGNIAMSGNKAANGGTAVYNGNGYLRIIGKPSLTDNTIYLGNGKTISVQSNLTGADKIIVTGDANMTAGRVIANVINADFAKAAAETLTVSNFATYADGTNIKIGNIVDLTWSKDLPAEKTIFAGTQLELEVLASGADNITYKWYVCDDAQGTNPREITSTSDVSNKLVYGDCNIGVCYFYCVATVNDGITPELKSQICTVNIVKFVPCSKAIEKFKNL